MLEKIIIPTRNIYELVLCTIGVYIVTKFTFPPNEPPPSFPFIFWNHKNLHSENKKENNL
jgi:hypothetical protein